MNLCRYAVCAKSCIGHHQMKYTTPASRTALRMIVLTHGIIGASRATALIWIMLSRLAAGWCRLTNEIELLTFAWADEECSNGARPHRQGC